MAQSVEFQRRILLGVCGLSPQVLTETVYALAVRRAPPWVPTEVHLVTTQEGAQRARLTLLGRSPGWFQRLCRDYQLGQIRFTEQQIHVLSDGNGAPLTDIRSREDNESAAGQIAALVRELTSDPDSALHVSIAGGRKTIGFYAGYALSLFGRPQDALSHVLVSAPFEAHPEFYYPTRTSRIIYTPPPDSRPLDTRTAEVTLAEIPFVRLRRLLPERLLAGNASYTELVRATEETLGTPKLVIDPDERAITAAGRTVRLPPSEFAFYAWMARRKLRGAEPVACPSEGAPESALAEEFLEEYMRADPGTTALERTRHALRDGMEKNYFLERKSRVNRLLEEALGASAGAYQIRGSGKRPDTRYGLGLEPEQIEFRRSRWEDE
jgi:CRISPR-associated protein (TIGR02584 family)